MTSPNSQDRRNVIRSMVTRSLLMPGIVSNLLAAQGGPLTPKDTHFAPKAKRVIFIFATGGVSHIDTFDPKSSENGRDGTGKDKLMGNLFGAARNRQCGTEVSGIFPHLREVMDEVCLIRSMKASHFDHSEATLGMHTGSPTFAPTERGLLGQLRIGHDQSESAQFHRHRTSPALRWNAGLRQRLLARVSPRHPSLYPATTRFPI